MSFSNDNNLSSPSEGSADWDSDLNANFQVLERGQHFRGTVGMQVNTGEAVTITGSGTVVLFDASSTGLEDVKGVSYSSISSGEEGFFPFMGIVRSLDVNTVNLVIGQPVFVSSEFPGLLVSSDGSGSAYAVGYAVDTTALVVGPFRTVTGGGGGGGTDVGSSLLGDLANVDESGAANGYFLQHNGTQWIANTLSVGSHDVFQGAFAYLTSVQETTSNGAIAWDAVSFDTSSMYSAANPTRLTVINGGRVSFSFAGRCDTAVSNQSFYVSINGINTSTWLGGVRDFRRDGSFSFNLSGGPISMAAGDFLEIRSTLVCTLSLSATWFAMEIIE